MPNSRVSPESTPSNDSTSPSPDLLTVTATREVKSASDRSRIAEPFSRETKSFKVDKKDAFIRSSKTKTDDSSVQGQNLELDMVDIFSSSQPSNFRSSKDVQIAGTNHLKGSSSSSSKEVLKRKLTKSRQISALIDNMSCLSMMTPYERVIKNLSNDDVWAKDIALGRRIGFYRLKGDAGTGNFSHVKIGIHCLTKEKVAVKILDKSKLDNKTSRMLSREISSMEKLHHPNLIRLFEVIETFSKVFLVMEFASGGELYQRITSEGKLSESVAKPLFAQIVSAIDHMHRHNIIHRDLKAENVFFSDPTTVKVGDFGFSTEVKSRLDLLNTFCGSPPYAAPELFADDSYVGPLVDIWALGVLLYFMVSGNMPFKAQTVSSLKQLILEGEYLMPDFLSTDCSRVIRGLLQHDPTRRLSIEDLKNGSWLLGQNFPTSLPKYKLTPSSMAHDSVTGTPGPIGSHEEEVRIQLQDLGIGHDLLQSNREKGVRSHVMGTYRIVYHRLISLKSFRPSVSVLVQGKQEQTDDQVTGNNNKQPDKATQNGVSITVTTASSASKVDLTKSDVDQDKNNRNKLRAGGSRRRNLWKDNRIFVDSEGFFIPNDLKPASKPGQCSSNGHLVDVDGQVTRVKKKKRWTTCSLF